MSEAPSGRIVLANAQVDAIVRGGGMPAALQRALSGERTEREDLRIVRGDGTRGVIRISAAPLFDDGGAQVGASSPSSTSPATGKSRKRSSSSLMSERAAYINGVSLQIDGALMGATF